MAVSEPTLYAVVAYESFHGSTLLSDSGLWGGPVLWCQRGSGEPEAHGTNTNGERGTDTLEGLRGNLPRRQNGSAKAPRLKQSGEWSGTARSRVAGGGCGGRLGGSARPGRDLGLYSKHALGGFWKAPSQRMS